MSSINNNQTNMQNAKMKQGKEDCTTEMVQSNNKLKGTLKIANY
jgi:hypothetical protein